MAGRCLPLFNPSRRWANDVRGELIDKLRELQGKCIDKKCKTGGGFEPVCSARHMLEVSGVKFSL